MAQNAKKISILEKTEVNRSGETVIRTDMTFLDDIETKEVFVEKTVEEQADH